MGNEAGSENVGEFAAAMAQELWDDRSLTYRGCGLGYMCVCVIKSV